ncbi:MAG TPA: hypothetical protein VJ953_08710 [Saprospiraceae bacterium]|nr:hypothetical protein [Saprospiraceae bacterium]
MHTIILRLTILLFVLSSVNFTALAIDIEKGIYEREGTSRSGIRIYLDVPADEVKDAFDDFLKKNYGFKLKGNGLFANKDELYAEKVEAKKIVEKQFNWYTEIIPAPRGEHQTQMTIFVSLGYDIYLSEENYPESFQKVYRLSIDFLEQYIPEYHKDLIEETSDLVEDLQDDTKDLQKDIDRNTKDIEKLKKEIREMEAERKEKIATLEKQQEKLQTQKEILRKAQQDLRRIN